MKKKGKKESNSIVLAYIADVSMSTNPSYMQTLSLRLNFFSQNKQLGCFMKQLKF